MRDKKSSIISLKRFINESLYEKNNGYYMTKNPFGNEGDFITSPNVSIFFSEMIAIWIVSFWKELSEPKNFNIIELGAGNGEMINVILSTLEKFPKLYKNVKVYIHEKSPILKKIQKKKIKNNKVNWINNFKKIKGNPCIFVANEFFDALPIQQFFKINNNWYEKKIKIEKGKKFKFIKIKTNIKKIEKKLNYEIAENQEILEVSQMAVNYIKKIAEIIKKNRGAMLIIDYGYQEKKMKNTLRGIRHHKIVNILDNYKKCDITYSLSFYHLMKIAEKNKLNTFGPVYQRNFLQSLGIMERAENVSKNLKFSKKADIFYRIEKLISKKHMGEIFKVLLMADKSINFRLGF
tara:strand:- start:2230 stop:3276 length:1047 start_codon:yes stop_codon:yes gene_type:complete